MAEASPQAAAKNAAAWQGCKVCLHLHCSLLLLDACRRALWGASLQVWRLVQHSHGTALVGSTALVVLLLLLLLMLLLRTLSGQRNRAAVNSMEVAVVICSSWTSCAPAQLPRCTLTEQRLVHSCQTGPFGRILRCHLATLLRKGSPGWLHFRYRLQCATKREDVCKYGSVANISRYLRCSITIGATHTYQLLLWGFKLHSADEIAKLHMTSIAQENIVRLDVEMAYQPGVQSLHCLQQLSGCQLHSWACRSAVQPLFQAASWAKLHEDPKCIGSLTHTLQGHNRTDALPRKLFEHLNLLQLAAL
mmetsp:Transcript_63836/g.152252  ORF Transcript_63836/g.152252 Transcript_63836/m.152252 type:complete len:305 (+) Transcript_63836:171-1085(+)